MPTVEIIKKFADQAMKVERVLRDAEIPGDAGRVVLILNLVNRDWGARQGEIVKALALPKDIVSKLIRSLVNADLLTQEREVANPRAKRLRATDTGRKLLYKVKLALQPPRPPKQESAGGYIQPTFFDIFEPETDEDSCSKLDP